MDVFDTLYLGTPANQALDAPLAAEQRKSMIGAAARKVSERQIDDYLVERTEPRGLAVRVRAVHRLRTHRGVLEDDERLEAEFLDECRNIEGRVH